MSVQTARQPSKTANEILCAHNGVKSELNRLRGRASREPEHQAKVTRAEIARLETERKVLIEQWRVAEIAEASVIQKAA